jgi:hypothetical protein
MFKKSGYNVSFMYMGIYLKQHGNMLRTAPFHGHSFKNFLGRGTAPSSNPTPLAVTGLSFSFFWPPQQQFLATPLCVRSQLQGPRIGIEYRRYCKDRGLGSSRYSKRIESKDRVSISILISGSTRPGLYLRLSSILCSINGYIMTHHVVFRLFQQLIKPANRKYD